MTDRDWFDQLRGRPDLTEANFWSPSDRAFKALRPGELFLFKLHAPDNFIVGGGVFTYANTLPTSLAWEAFREANGALSLVEMRRRIARYRRVDESERGDFPIGCRILTRPVFLPEEAWLPVPASWSANIVSFKTYSTDELEGRRLWEAVEPRRAAADALERDRRYGEPQLVRPRLGQGTFRVIVTDSYHRRCAVTGERTLPALEAAHIRPYSEGGEHSVSNGLLLRRDVHSLFDAGYVTVGPDLRFEVSKRIREEFENGRHYYALQGQRVTAPADPHLCPDEGLLRWHNETRFLG